MLLYIQISGLGLYQMLGFSKGSYRKYSFTTLAKVCRLVSSSSLVSYRMDPITAHTTSKYRQPKHLNVNYIKMTLADLHLLTC